MRTQKSPTRIAPSGALWLLTVLVDELPNARHVIFVRVMFASFPPSDCAGRDTKLFGDSLPTPLFAAAQKKEFLDQCRLDGHAPFCHAVHFVAISFLS
jgi:hypothetical protein